MSSTSSSIFSSRSWVPSEASVSSTSSSRRVPCFWPPVSLAVIALYLPFGALALILAQHWVAQPPSRGPIFASYFGLATLPRVGHQEVRGQDRKSTRLNSSHVSTSYAVFC